MMLFNKVISINMILERYNSLPIQIKAAFWFFICAFTNKVFAVFSTPIFTRILSTSEFGKYNVYCSWLGIGTVFISLNLSLGGFVRGLIKFEEEKNQFASSLQSLTLLLVCVWAIIYFPLSSYVNSLSGLDTIQTTLMFLTIWLTAVYGFWAASQRVDYKYRILVPITILVSFLGQALGVFFVTLFDDKVTARIFGTVIVYFLFYIYFFVKILKTGKTFFHKKFWTYALSFNLPLLPHYLSQTILNSSDRIMIEKMVGSSEAGIYGLAYSIAQVMAMFNMALAQTEEPWLYRKIRDNRIEDIASITYVSLFFISSVNIFLIAFASEIVIFFAPIEYYDAIWVIPPVSMSLFFSFSYYFFAVFEYYFEKTKQIAIASCIGAVLNVILNYIFIPKFGYIASGYTTLFCFIIYAVIHYYFMNKICSEEFCGREPFCLKKYLIIAISFMSIGFLFLFTYDCFLLRYSLFSILILIAVVKKESIVNGARKLIKVRKC